MPRIPKRKTIQEKKDEGEYIPPVLILEDSLHAGNPVVVGTLADIQDCKRRKPIPHSFDMATVLIGGMNTREVDLDKYVMIESTDKNLPINQNAMMLASRLSGYTWKVRGRVIFIPKNLYTK